MNGLVGGEGRRRKHPDTAIVRRAGEAAAAPLTFLCYLFFSVIQP
jgi:hypothetical protein